MSNRKLGNAFEAELCERLSEYGFWAHNMAQNSAGQPADVIAARNKVAYLIGVDLKETTEPFDHWHGVKNTSHMHIEALQDEKKAIYKYCNKMKIYQCNPDVANEWQIPYFKVKDLKYKP